MIAPAGVGGGTAAASVGAVDDVVVDQGGAVEKFDDSGEFDGAAAFGRRTGGVAVTEQKQCRAKALPSPAE